MAGHLMVARRRRAVGRPMAHRPTPQSDPRKNVLIVGWLALKRYGFLYDVARRSGVDSQQIGDVVHDALLDMLRSFTGPYDVEHVVAYAKRCVQSEAWKEHRRYTRKESRREGGDDELALVLEYVERGDPDPLEVVIAAETARERQELLAELPDDQRTVLLLVAAGLNHEEIASRLEISKRGVRKRIERARRRLRELGWGAF